MDESGDVGAEAWRTQHGYAKACPATARQGDDGSSPGGNLPAASESPADPLDEPSPLECGPHMIRPGGKWEPV